MGHLLWTTGVAWTIEPRVPAAELRLSGYLVMNDKFLNYFGGRFKETLQKIRAKHRIQVLYMVPQGLRFRRLGFHGSYFPAVSETPAASTRFDAKGCGG